MNNRVVRRIRKWARVISDYKALSKADIEKGIKEQWLGLPTKDRSYFAEQMDKTVEKMRLVIAKRLGKDELGAIK